jgi:hypothetical protein
MKQTNNDWDLGPGKPQGPRWLIWLAFAVVVAFGLLLLVGFENILELLRYRAALFLVIGPILGLFLWCLWKGFRPRQ